MSEASVSTLHSYPLKSGKGQNLESMNISHAGPSNDRRWLIIDDQGTIITQRLFPKLAVLEFSVDDLFIRIKAPNSAEITAPLKPGPELLQVQLWKDPCEVLSYGPQVNNYLSAYLEKTVRLVTMSNSYRRLLSDKYAINPGQDYLYFADSMPFLLSNEESLALLNQKLEHSVPMNRFRPNIVIKNAEAFAEDTWQNVRIGQVQFRAAKPCARCIVVNINQESAEKNLEPLKTLSTFRKREKGVIFGMYLVAVTTGTIHLNDPLQFINI